MKTVICNWKLNPQSFLEAKQLFEATKKIAKVYKNTSIIVIPPSIFLYPLASGYRGTRMEFGAQSVSKATSGSHTGEISARQVHNSKATYALVGHAEQRASGVTNDDIREKVRICLSEKVSPIVAVGESTRDSEGVYITTIREQISIAFTDVPVSQFKKITIAYEPIWAIGAPDAPDAHAVHQMVVLVRKLVSEQFGEKAMKAVRVVYGGAVTEENAASILSVPGLHGVLVGRASLDPSRLKGIVAAAHIV